MLSSLVRVKQRLWRRYNMFYDVDTIEEVYPENELMEWVWDAWGEKAEPVIKWRDKEMGYEWTNEWCGRQAPKKIRSYEEEVQVQERRRRYREGKFAWSMCEGLRMPDLARKALEMSGNSLTQEMRDFLEERRRFWERRRNPCKEQHDAGEPNHHRWDAVREEKASMLGVRLRGGGKKRVSGGS